MSKLFFIFKVPILLCDIGKMYPTQGILYCAPFTDDMLYMEQFNKVSFWYCIIVHHTYNSISPDNSTFLRPVSIIHSIL